MTGSCSTSHWYDQPCYSDVHSRVIETTRTTLSHINSYIHSYLFGGGYASSSREREVAQLTRQCGRWPVSAQNPPGAADATWQRSKLIARLPVIRATDRRTSRRRRWPKRGRSRARGGTVSHAVCKMKKGRPFKDGPQQASRRRHRGGLVSPSQEGGDLSLPQEGQVAVGPSTWRGKHQRLGKKDRRAAQQRPSTWKGKLVLPLYRPQQWSKAHRTCKSHRPNGRFSYAHGIGGSRHPLRA